MRHAPSHSLILLITNFFPTFAPLPTFVLFRGIPEMKAEFDFRSSKRNLFFLATFCRIPLFPSEKKVIILIALQRLHQAKCVSLSLFLPPLKACRKKLRGRKKEEEGKSAMASHKAASLHAGQRSGGSFLAGRFDRHDH